MSDLIVQHGIEFGYVGGDPAELMRICVENGTFTVAFLKEGVQKVRVGCFMDPFGSNSIIAQFRGWIDDLLKTSWEACQGTDVLVESPSAMGGVHIAEALRIPYFRAFTMTWSRTRYVLHAHDSLDECSRGVQGVSARIRSARTQDGRKLQLHGTLNQPSGALVI